MKLWRMQPELGTNWKNHPCSRRSGTHWT